MKQNAVNHRWSIVILQNRDRDTVAYNVMDAYTKRFPRATQCLENGLEDSLTFYAFPKLDARKISSSNMIEHLNSEIRRRTSEVGSSQTRRSTSIW